MKLLYLHQYFRAPSHQGGTRSYWLSLAFKHYYSHVYMVTSHQTFSHGFLNRYQLDGIDVISFYIPYSQKFGSVARYLSFAIFSLFAFYCFAISRF